MDEVQIFLSHSGAQKDFTWRLYLELVHQGYRVFFDQDTQDSLPKGLPFPPRILQACRSCKMGIIVLSHDYVESLWPMLELEQLTFHNPSAPNNLYPLFYKLSPADLSKEENLERWQATWKENETAWQSKVREVQASSTSEISISIRSWLQALQKLRYQSGSECFSRMRDHVYIEEIVSDISKTMPLSRRSIYLLDEHVKGKERMQQVIDDLFHQAPQKSSTSTSTEHGVVVGVWGMGGLGKTTLCKHMVNFYGKEFPGMSSLLELPTEEDERMLAEVIKELLLTLRRAKKEDLENISSVDKIMVLLEEGLRSQQVFLAIDNVWDWAIQRVKQIMSMVCMAGSKILVTGRSKQIVEKVLIPWRNSIVHIPSITEEEAVEALKCFSCVLPVPPKLDEDLRRLARGLCFFEEQCHPLLVKVTGAKLRHRSGGLKNEQDWNDLISRLLQDAGGLIHDEEETILKVLGRSLLALTPNLQDVFIDLVTCVPPYRGFSWNDCYGGFLGTCKWLSMIHDGFTEMDMRDKMIELQYHGLLEIITDSQIRIHDLYKSVARRRCDAAGGSADACFFGKSLSELPKDKYKQIKYIVSDLNFGTKAILRALMHRSNLEIFEIYTDGKEPPALQLSVQSLRYLELENCRSLKRIEGWKGTPNLVSLQLLGCRSLLNLGDIGCLRKLEELRVSESRCVPDLSRCIQLKKLAFSHCVSLKKLASLGQPPNLEQLCLRGNMRLVDVSTIRTFTALQDLDLSDCTTLEEIRTINASNLLTLDLHGCESLQELGSLCALTAVETLSLGGCHKLQRITNVKNLARLKVFDAGGCRSLKEVNSLCVSSVTSLQVFNLTGCTSPTKVKSPFSSSLSARQALELVLGVSADLQQAHEGQLPSCICTHVENGEHELYGGAGESDTINVGNNIGSPIIMLHRADDRSAAFLENLRELRIQGTYWSDNISSLDVNGLTSLVTLGLASFRISSLQEIRGLSTLVKLEHLHIRGCSLLKEIHGTGSLISDDQHASLENGCSTSHEVAVPTLPPNITTLCIEYCSSLRELPTLTHLTKLECISLTGCSSLLYAPQVHYSVYNYDLYQCPSLTDVSSLASVLSLRVVQLHDCSSLKEIPNLTHLTYLCLINVSGCSSLVRAPQVHSSVEEYKLEGCSSLMDVSSLASVSSLRRVSLRDCSSLREIPNLTHLTDLLFIDVAGCSSLVRAPQVPRRTKVEKNKVEKTRSRITKLFSVCKGDKNKE